MISAKYSALLRDYDKHCRRIDQATSIDIAESPQNKNSRIQRLERDYVSWFEYYFPDYASVKCAWFHKEAANVLVKNKKVRLLSELYRSAGKSVHIDMGIPLYLYLAKQDLKFMLLVGETEKKAVQLLSGIQGQLQYNNRIKNDYGEKFSQGDWSEGKFLTSDGIRFQSLGFMQSPRGAREGAARPDYIVVDDVDDKRHVNNDRMMREAIDFITEDIWGCFDSSDTATERFVFANNNFHKNSITNRMDQYFRTVIDGKTRSKTAVNYKILKVAAVKNLGTFEPEWPEKTSAAYWRDKYSGMPYRSFMREYMHMHIQDGAVFKPENIRYIKPLPMRKYDALCMYGDLSYKDTGDYKALILVGKSGREFHVLLSYLRQGSRADAAIWLYDQYEHYKLAPLNISYMIEGLFAMDDFVSDFDAEGDKRGYYIPVRADKRSKADKYDRIESMAGFFERGNVSFNELLKNADQVLLIDQLLAFEKGSKAHDDGPDALQGAMSQLNRRTAVRDAGYAFAPRSNSRY